MRKVSDKVRRRHRVANVERDSSQREEGAPQHEDHAAPLSDPGALSNSRKGSNQQSHHGILKLQEELSDLRTKQSEQESLLVRLLSSVEQLKGDLANVRQEQKLTDTKCSAADLELQQTITSLQSEMSDRFSRSAAALSSLEQRMTVIEASDEQPQTISRLNAVQTTHQSTKPNTSIGDEARASAIISKDAPASARARQRGAPIPEELPPQHVAAQGARASVVYAAEHETDAQRLPVPKRYGGGGHPCTKCGKTVYAAESFFAKGHAFHRDCFRCAHCDTKLQNSPNWEMLKGDFYCQAHFMQRVRTDGGKSKNELSEKEISTSEVRDIIDKKVQAAELEYETGLARARCYHLMP
ncbi:MAG: hypothetical protein SGPRY_002979 [Prymnesium sp.]